MRIFVKIKSSRIGEINRLLTGTIYMGKSHPCRECQRRKSVFYAIRENKILAKISEFTVLKLCTRRMMLFGQFMSNVNKASDFFFKMDKSIEKAVIQYLDNLECLAPTIRIYHECEGRIEKSVPSIAFCHHSAC